MTDVPQNPQLSTLNRLLGMLVAEGRRQNEQILVLWKAGMDPHEIAQLIGTSVNTVRVEISKLRKRENIKIPERSD